ncbi:MAG: 3'(2'),5'-bisphosphate nucleotidase [Phycisphaerales bacterium]|nr:MAG: 3'(2'),5'-bisphosphate nucleotidase [Phycisphaerales bacterium]
MSTTDPQIRTALRTVAESCRVARAVQKDLQRVRQITKDDRSPVTVADFAVQAIVSLALHEHDPDVLIVGEERADALRADGQTAVRQAVVEAVRRCRPGVTEEQVLDAIDRGGHDGSAEAYWALDPIDGTKGFLRGQQYAIALGRIESGRVVLGVMGCPNLPADFAASLSQADDRGLLYLGAAGQGAWQLPADDPHADARAVKARDAAPEHGLQVCESVESGHSRQDDTKRIVDELGGAGDPVRLDSQCKYAVVARGQADAYLRFPTSRSYVEKIWDHAAGSVIASESGAVVTDITGAGLDFTHGRRLEVNRGIVCASAPVHGQILEAIERLNLGIPARVEG